MKNDCLTSTMPSTFADARAQWDRVVRRRSFLRGLGVMGAALPITALSGIDASAAVSGGRTLTHGDASVLRFLAAAELLESDLWTQYNELGGVSGGNAAYVAALQNLDGDMPQYITDNTDDELSHAAFLNAYLHAHGADPRRPGRVPHAPRQPGHRLRPLGPAHQPAEARRGHELVQRAIAAAGTPTWGGTFAQAVAIHDEPADPPERHRHPSRRAAAEPARHDRGAPHAGDREHRRVSTSR